MSHSQVFSEVTKRYLARFYEILEQMINGMTSVELSDSISQNFILQMIPHHEAAIQMSENILQYTTCIRIQQIAQTIVVEQTKSIEAMQQALPCCHTCVNSQTDLHLYQRRFDQVTRTMFWNMENAISTNSVDLNFLREMIPHHKGAIQMSQNTLRYPICPELLPILEAIITSQKKGVQEMQRLLQCS